VTLETQKNKSFLDYIFKNRLKMIIKPFYVVKPGKRGMVLI